MTASPEVVLFGRDGCHLCDEARDRLVELSRHGTRFALREVDIDSDADLLSRHLERIPVVELDGLEVCSLGLDEDRLIERLGNF